MCRNRRFFFLSSPYSRHCTAQVWLQTQAPDSRGFGFLLARGKMRWRTGDTCLSAASCVSCSPPLAFFCKPRGTAPEIHSRLWLKPYLRVPSPIQHPAPVCLQTQAPDSRGSGFLLARGKMRWRTGDTCLSAASCVSCSPPLAFFCKPRGTAPEIHSRLWLKPYLRVPFAKFLKLTFHHTYRYFLAINNSTANRSDNLPVFTASSDSTQNST